MSERGLSRLRDDVRALIRLANDLESAHSTETSDGTGARLRDTGRKPALLVAESRLAGSIALVMAEGVGIGAIEEDVIRPILGRSVVLSATASDAVGRAVGSVPRGFDA